MADPVALTSVVLGAAAAVTSALTPIILARRKTSKEKTAATVASWTSLNEALARENTRLETALERQRSDCERRMAASDAKITELESDNAALRRLLGPRRPD